jgi:hypothetical protein
MTTEEQGRRLAARRLLVTKPGMTERGAAVDVLDAQSDPIVQIARFFGDNATADAELFVTATAPQGDAGEVARKIVNSCSTWGGLTNNAELIEAIAAALHQREQAARAEERRKCATAAAIHSCYPIETDWERGYDTGRKDAAAAIRNPGQVEK